MKNGMRVVMLSGRPRWISLELRSWILVAPAVLFLLTLFVLPLARFLIQSFISNNSFSFEFYSHIFSNSVYLKVLAVTFEVACLTTLFSVIASYPLAYWIARLQGQSRTRVLMWVLVPFWTSFLVRTFAWMVLLGRSGPINELLLKLGIQEPPALMFNLVGVLIGMVHALMPYSILALISVMEHVDRRLVQSAETLGARPGQAFARVYLPLSLPGIATAGLLVFISALGFFITPAFLGGAREIMIAQVIIQNVNQLLNWQLAGALSVVLFITTIGAVLVYNRLFGSVTLYADVMAGTGIAGVEGGVRHLLGLTQVRRLASGLVLSIVDRSAFWMERLARSIDHDHPERAERLLRKLGSVALAGVAITGLLYLALPGFFVIPVSFSGSSSLEFPPQVFSLRWYRTVLTSEAWISSVILSLQVAFLAACLATVLGIPVAFALARSDFPVKNLVTMLVLSPMIIPRIVTAVALFYGFVELGLVGSVPALVLGHAVLGLPFVVLTLSGVLARYDPRLDYAALTLGANRLRVLRHVTLPIIRTGLLSAWLFAFITSFDDLTVALFVTGGLLRTLPRQMWDEMLLQVNPTIAVMSTILITVTTMTLLVIQRIQQRGATVGG